MPKFSIAALVLLLCLNTGAIAQPLVQTIRGTVTDRVTQSPVPGALVLVLNSQPAQVTQSDERGQFRIDKVPVGKQSLQVTFVGYKAQTLQNLVVNAGKELVLTINLEEEIAEMDVVEVTVKQDKNKPLNEMSAVSTRAFSVEETQKFAASVNDPARMATSFAGVVAPSDGNNHISIRGNSPNGLLWRMEGVEIPNPNHFANVGTSGGGISILSAQLLNNSDFSTGAFAAEYGNALSGVFDLKLRKGNNQKREYTFQAGILGIDVAAEGPFKKGSEGSYLVNYRYSTLSILGKIGVPLGDGITNFQDLSFNVSLPTRKMGTFSLFGFGGLSSQTTEPVKDTLTWEKDYFYRLNTNYYANAGMTGFTNTKLFTKGYLKTIVGLSATKNGYYEEEMQKNYTTLTRHFEQAYVQRKLTLSSTYTHKITAASSFRCGFILNQLGYDLRQNILEDSSQKMVERIRVDGSTGTSQGFFQWSQRLGTQLTTNVGLHYFHVFLNNSKSLEPRASVRYEINAANALTLGYGLHSQIQPLGIYFARPQGETNQQVLPNKDLGLSRAHHFVAGLDHLLDEHSHIKTEVYFQHLFNVPVSTQAGNSFSTLNLTDGYYTGSLVNNGLGRNKGVEFTYERFLHRNLYWLISASSYDSKYRASNGNWYNTRYNSSYALTATGGKEWTISTTKNRVLGVNIKSMYIGGFRYTPIDLVKSMENGETVLMTERSFSDKNPDYYRLDIRISLKRNYRRVTSTLALDLQNATNRKNVGGQYFDAKTGKVKYWYQTPLIPVLSYRIEF